MRTLIAAAIGAASFLATVRADIDPAGFDPAVRPQDDFYHHVNGTWLKTHPIPEIYSSWGAFYEVEEHNLAALHSILEKAAAAKNPGPIERRVGDFYASGMDEAAADAAGISPLRAELDRVASIQSAADAQAVLARFHRMDVDVGFSLASEQDPKDSVRMIAGAGQAGLGLPDRDYYFRDDPKSAELRKQYAAHIARMLVLAGDAEAQAKGEAEAVMAFETALAKGSKTDVELRDPVANYHKMPLAEVQKLTPEFKWPAYLSGIGLAAPSDIDIGQPEFFRAFDSALSSAPVPELRAYFRWHLVHAFAPYLSRAFVAENFSFYGTALTGTPQLRERWKRVLSTVDGSIGEDLGRLYVAENFPPESKARMLKLVTGLEAELRERIQALPWMDEPTRAKALEKLAALGLKIGYPDKWIDYSTLKVDRGPYVLNVLRAREFNVRRDLNKIGKPVDRAEWGMTPPTVNAYYNPSMNEIVFPAGILQAPFFDAKADDAVNYGAIGAVIGHEMTHGFDDEGKQFDLRGNLAEWWTPESAKRFNERAAGIVRQFNGCVAIDNLHVNGELTQGENIADLGGVKIAFYALRKALAGSHAAIGGYSPEQRFFLSFATIYRENIRPDALRLQVNTDPHSPPQFRVNGPLSNLPEFSEAFGIPADSPMARPPKERVEIW